MEWQRVKTLDVQQIGELVKADYRQVTAKYRRDDEIEVLTENHRRLEMKLRGITDSFAAPIHVLDVGCGTGRYFHCLSNVERLVGLDISEDMLRAAQNPVCSERVRIPRIELRCGNAHVQEFEPESFDFIYSLGMFGHGCPVTVEICTRFHRWLKPGGVLLFNVVDFAGLPLCYRVRRHVRHIVYPALTRRLQQVLDARESRAPFFYLTDRQAREIIRQTPFNEAEIASHLCTSPLGNGRHLECLTRKKPGPQPRESLGFLR